MDQPSPDQELNPTATTVPTSGGAAPPQHRPTSEPLNLLADLESRLGQIRAWQAQTEKQVETMEAESQRLASRQETLDDYRQKLDQRQSEIDLAWENVECDTIRLDSHRKALDIDRDAFEEKVREHQQQAEQARAELDRQAKALEAEIAEKRAAVKAESAEMREQTEREIAEKRQRVTDELDAKRSELETEVAQQQDALDRLSEQLEQRQTDLEASEQRALEDQEKLDQQAADLASQREQLDAQLAEAAEREAKVKAKGDLLARRQHDLDEQESKAAEFKTSLERRQDDLDLWRGELEVDRQTVAKLKTQLIEQRKTVERKRIDLDLQAESIQAQQRKLDQTREELVEQSIRAADVEGQAHAEPGEAQVPAELTQQLDALKERRAEVEQQEAQAKQTRAQIEEQQQELEQAQAALSRKQLELEQWSAELEQQAARAPQSDASEASAEDHDSGDTVMGGQFVEGLAEFEAQRAKFEQRKKAFKETLEQTKAQLSEQRDRIKQREADVASQASELENERLRLKDKTRRIKEAEASIQTRRNKLRTYLRIVKQRSNALRDSENRVQSSGQQFAGLDKERQMLSEVKKFLEQSEGDMVRRWATQKATGYIVGIVLAVVAVAGIALSLGSSMTEPVFKTTMDVQLDGPADETGLPTPGPNADVFTKTLAMNPKVLSATLTQMDRDQANRLFENVEGLRADLEQNLTVTGDKGEYTLAYASVGTQRGVQVLDALRHSMLGYQMTVDRQAGRADSLRVTRAPARIDDPVSDARWSMTAQVFGIGLGVAVVLFVLLRFVLLRSKRSFDPGDHPGLEMLDKPGTWSPVPTPTPAPAHDAAE